MLHQIMSYSNPTLDFLKKINLKVKLNANKTFIRKWIDADFWAALVTILTNPTSRATHSKFSVGEHSF